MFVQALTAVIKQPDTFYCSNLEYAVPMLEFDMNHGSEGYVSTALFPSLVAMSGADVPLPSNLVM
jgi:hypothetical protein